MKRYYILGSAAIIAILGVGLHWNIVKLPITIGIHPSNITDFANDRKLVGASHNVFLGKVLGTVGNKQLGSVPETQFEVSVISNIKGQLHGIVIVDQYGGYKNGLLYAIEGEQMSASGRSSDALLKRGSTYILAVRFEQVNNWFMLLSHPNAEELVSRDEQVDSGKLESLASARITALQEAYKTEVLLASDVKHNSTWNSYQSRRYDVRGNLIDDTVVLQEQYLAAHGSNVPATNESAAPEVITPVSTTPSIDSGQATPEETTSPMAIPEESLLPTASPEVSATATETPAPTSEAPAPTPTPELSPSEIAPPGPSL